MGASIEGKFVRSGRDRSARGDGLIYPTSRERSGNDDSNIEFTSARTGVARADGLIHHTGCGRHRSGKVSGDVELNAAGTGTARGGEAVIPPTGRQ